MILDQATVDDITAATAAAVLDDVEGHMRAWQRDRNRRTKPAGRSGLAGAGDLGGDLLLVIAQSVPPIWDWCVANAGNFALNVTASALVAETFRILDSRAKGLKLSKEELDALSDAMATKVREEFDRRGIASEKDTGTPVPGEDQK